MSKIKVALASSTLALCMLPGVGWSTHPFGTPVAGQVTSLPGGDEIEVGNRTYHIKQGSAAEKVVSQLSTGQRVHLILDGPADSPTSKVITISVDSEP